MPRGLRCFLEGGIYHVYNRFSSGEPVFADPEEALDFIELLRFVKQRDDWTVFAWVLMPNHYHLAIRSRAIPISRGFQYLQGRFSQRFNRGRRRTGALWQSRYHAKPINEQGYLDRVILYIHLNPVAAGLVPRPVDHVFGGHREIVKRVSNPVIDVEDCLLSFGQKYREARKVYLSAIRLGCKGRGENTDREAKRPAIWFQPDRDLVSGDDGPYIGVLGRSTGPERDALSADDFIRRCADTLHIKVEDLASRSRLRTLVEARRLIVSLGRERWAQSTNGLALALHKSADTVTYIQREGVRLRLGDDRFQRHYEELDRQLIGGLHDLR